MKYPTITKESMIRIFALSFTLLLLLPMASDAQDRKALEAKRQKLLEQIELTSRKLGKASKDIGNAVADVRNLEAQLKARQTLMANLNAEMKLIDQQLTSESNNLKQAQDQLLALKQNYGQMLQTAYVSRQMENPVLFLLSANTMNEAFQRWQYLQQIERHRKNQFGKLLSQRDSITTIIARIDQAKIDKSAAKTSAQNQEREVQKSVATQEKLIQRLKADEQTLKKQLSNQEAESKKLASEIDKIIRAEVAKNAGPNALPDAPALARLTASFGENKGKLPWPIKKGVITGKFGNQPHPVLKTIYINNNGVDFSVEENAQVFAVFEGVVVGKKFIPGYDEMLIIQHGKYYTVYSRLAQTYVDKGDKVKTQQLIGKASSTSGSAQIHFELWQEKTLQNPETWLVD